MRIGRVALLAMAGLATACSNLKAPTAPPVANVTFTASRPRVAIGSPIDLTYKFDVLPNASISGDYTVFVHVLDADGTMIWTDDHDPPVKTSQWKPGQTIGPYTRTRFVPQFPYTGQATIVVGLYKPGANERLGLSSAVDDGRAASRREYKAGTLEIIPAPANLVFGRGWYDPDGDPQNPANRWRWTTKSAAMAMRNPKADTTLYLESDARADIFTPPQTVTIVVNGQAVSTFSATNTQAELRKIPIAASQLGTGDIVEIRIDVDRTFNPSQLPVRALDTRDLGIRVYNVFLETR